MKKLITVLFLSSLSFLAKAQLPDGSIAPDWTFSDINNQSHTLYNYLDSGYVVFLSFNATWVPSGWTYHQSNALKDLYNLYGPGTTDNKVRVFFIEGDASTSSNDLNGTGTNTQGDWITGTPYPIIDNSSLTSLYQIGFWPTIYQICPSRVITEIGQASMSMLWTGAQAANCSAAVHLSDAVIVDYLGDQSICSGSFTPKVSILNIGTNNMTSATINVKDGNTTLLSQAWTGNLSTYGQDTILLNPVSLSTTSNLTFEIVVPNDGDLSNNSINQDIIIPILVPTDTLLLQINTDNYGFETYWAIVDDNNIIHAEGGNTNVGLSGGGAQVASVTDPNAYLSNSLINETIILPIGGCFRFVIVDDWGDGICCSYGNGSYNLYDYNYGLIGSGGSFTVNEESPFSKATTTTTSDLEILSYNGNNVSCDNNFNPSIVITNNGPDILTNATVTVASGVNVIYTYPWTGSLLAGDTTSINLGTVPIGNSGTYTVNISSAAADLNLSNNMISQPLIIAPASSLNQFAVNIQTDIHGYETYWAILDDFGNLIADGGNPIVGLNGGGLQVATPADPGSYPSNSLIMDTVFLSDAGCYHLHLVDDGGTGATSIVDLTEISGTTLANSYSFTNDTIIQFSVNQSVLAIDGEIVSFDADIHQCGDKFPVVVSVANNGYFDLHSFTIDVSENSNIIQTFNWNGTLSPLNTIQIALDSITLTSSALIDLDIQVTGDNDLSNNHLAQPISLATISSRDSFTLELISDSKGYEIYWAVTDEQGSIVVDGGNTNVGLNGGGLQISSPANPGAYNNNTVISETIAVPLDGCYQLHFVDDGGDGFCCNGGSNNYSLTDFHNNVLSNGTLFGTDTSTNFITFTAVGTQEISAIEEFRLFPNPASQSINVQFSVNRPSTTNMKITNALGAIVQSYEPSVFNAGFYNEKLDISDLISGIYYLSINNGEQIISRKFVVIK